MKKTIIALLILSFSSLYSQTSVEQFNYILQEYDHQENTNVRFETNKFVDEMFSGAGLEMKFTFFYNGNDTIPFGTLLKFNLKSKPNKVYSICIPHVNSSLEVTSLFLGQFEFKDDFKYQKIRKQYVAETCAKISNLYSTVKYPFARFDSVETGEEAEEMIEVTE